MNVSEVGHRRFRRAINATLLTATLAGGLAACTPEKPDPGLKLARLKSQITGNGAPQPPSVDFHTEVCGPDGYIKFDDGGMAGNSGGEEGATVSSLTSKLVQTLEPQTNPNNPQYSVVIWTDQGQKPVSLSQALSNDTVVYGNDGVLMETFTCGNTSTLPEDHPYRAQQDTSNH